MAQQISEESIDSISYEQFLKRDLKGLKETVQFAQTQKIDFYYLHLRAAILAFENKNYEYCIPHFKDAIIYYPNDTISAEYLYYAYKYTAREDDAQKFAANRPVSFQQKIGYSSKKINLIGIGGGAFLTNNISLNKSKSYETILSEGDIGIRNLNGNAIYGEMFLSNTIKSKFHLSNSLSIYQTNNFLQADEFIDPTTEKSNFTAKNNHFQYHLGFGFTNKKSWIFNSGLGYYKVNSNYISIIKDTINKTVEILNEDFNLNSFLLGFTIAKRFKSLTPYLSCTISNLNAFRQFQAEVGVTYYPMGNYNLYGNSGFAFLKNNNENQFVFTQKIGFKLTKWWWNEGNFKIGNLSNYNTANGALTYNTLDPILLLAGTDFNFYLTKQIQFKIGYEFQKRKQSYYINKNNQDTFAIINSNYFTHLLKTTLIWNF